MSPADFPPDDATIGDEVALWRRIGPLWYIPDKNLGKRRVASAAFQNQDHEAFSVWISSDAEDRDLGPEAMIANHPGYGVASFTAGLARELGQGVIRKPEAGEIAHGHVVGHKTGATKKKFWRGCKVLIEPDVVQEP